MNVVACINHFLSPPSGQKNKGKLPEERYASFDYCYSYFYSFYRKGNIADIAKEKNLFTSCLQLGFYLASWGMLRGSSFLLEKSQRYYIPLVYQISKMDKAAWEIDVDKYTSSNIDYLLDCKQKVSNAICPQRPVSDTLITKIMLGVFGNIPAYDQYVRKSLKVSALSRKSLIKVKKFYEHHQAEIDEYSSRIFTYDFHSGNTTDIKYPKAKILDMCCFIDGQGKA